MQGHNQRTVEKLATEFEHVGKNRFAADPIDEGRYVLDGSRFARCKGRGERSRRFDLGSIDTYLGSECAQDRCDAARQTSAAPWDYDCLQVRQILEQFQRDRRVARHDVWVIEGVDERGVDARIAARLKRLPPLSEWNLDYPPSHALDRTSLSRRGSVGSNDCGWNAEPLCAECNALCHVPRGRGKQSATQLLLRSMRDHVRRAPNLERANGLQILQLQIQARGA